eukprot:6173136-Pleurochrysis_carterae.AAC.1
MNTTTRGINEEEELALRQVISGIIPEWQETDHREKKGIIMAMGLWTGAMMNGARVQMKLWMEKKNAHKDNVHRRWDNRGKMQRMFQK